MDTQFSSSASLLYSEETANFLYNELKGFTTLLSQNGEPIFACSQSETTSCEPPGQYTSIVEKSDDVADHEIHIETQSYFVRPPIDTEKPLAYNALPSTYYNNGYANTTSYTQLQPACFHNAESDLNHNFRNELRFEESYATPLVQTCSPAREPKTAELAENYSQHVPSNTAYSGPFGFEIFVEELRERALKKSISYTYSTLCNKLFVRPKEVCPISFRLKRRPHVSTAIRAMAIFSSPQEVFLTVKRCANHIDADRGHAAPAHLVRCVDSRASYQEDPQSGRHSVTVPYEPALSDESFTVRYQFMCYGSCDSIKRRPIQLIFTLENDGRTIGRQITELRVCACPGRDRQIAETQLSAEYPSKRKCRRVNNVTTVTSVEPVPKEPKTSDSIADGGKDSEQSYVIEIKDRQLYKLVLTIVRNYELAKRFEETHTETGAATSYSIPRNQTNYSVASNSSQPVQLTSQVQNSGIGLSQERRFDGAMSIEAWLEALDLSKYAAAFKKLSYLRLEHLEFVSAEVLKKLIAVEEDFEKVYGSLTRWRVVRNSFSSQVSSLATPPSPNKGLRISRTTVKHSYKI